MEENDRQNKNQWENVEKVYDWEKKKITISYKNCKWQSDSSTFSKRKKSLLRISFKNYKI